MEDDLSKGPRTHGGVTRRDKLQDKELEPAQDGIPIRPFPTRNYNPLVGIYFLSFSRRYKSSFIFKILTLPE